MKAKRYKVLFADDEYWTRGKIKGMIPWEEYDIDFLEPAVDGEDVLKKINIEKPDILITDINMPFMDGTELLKIISEKYSDIITFVISGYDDFDYVKSSFMSGAINYLVKPISKIDLVNAIVKALEMKSERETEKDELLKAASHLKDREFSRMIKRDNIAYVPSVTGNINLENAGMTMVMIKMHNLFQTKIPADADIEMLICDIKQEISRIIEGKDEIVFNNIYHQDEFIIITNRPQKEVYELIDKVTSHFLSYDKVKITVCVSEHSYSLKGLHIAYNEIVSLLMKRTVNKRKEIISSNNESKANVRSALSFTSEHEKLIKNFVLSGNLEALKRLLLDTIGLRDCMEKPFLYADVRRTVKKVIEALVSIRKEFGAGEEADENYIVLAESVIEQLDSEALVKMLLNVIGEISTSKGEQASDSIRKVVRKVARFIDEHYYEDISLASLADKYYVESSYLSKVFHQEIGESLILYLTNKRMEKVKEFMHDDNISLTDIAAMVGYYDYTYFSRVFKKTQGCSPREYRNKIEKE